MWIGELAILERKTITKNTTVRNLHKSRNILSRSQNSKFIPVREGGYLLAVSPSNTKDNITQNTMTKNIMLFCLSCSVLLMRIKSELLFFIAYKLASVPCFTFGFSKICF